MTTADPRLEALYDWTQSVLPDSDGELSPASADASFRRYFRWRGPQRSYVCMDAPPDKENVAPFIAITKRLEQSGVHVPHVHATNLDQGFLLLDDLGQRDYLSQLNNDSVDRLYTDALNTLLRIASAKHQGLPRYDDTLLQREMALFVDWFLGRYCGITPNDDERAILQRSFDALSAEARAQPQVFVHRDYHSRNLMLTEHRNPGVIDYQDAVHGPITYDLVSLLKDCYIAWPTENVQRWALEYRDAAMQNGLMPDTDDASFLRWFDLMGAQRHLKAIGIFSRLNYRDDKPGYLQDIPRTFNYLYDCAERYPEVLGDFLSLLQSWRLREQLAA